VKTITFISDFGTEDWFVAAVKGEIFKIADDVRLVDITHSIMPFDIRGAAFLLSAVYCNFPKGTVHLAVIDPGVGGKRKPIVVDSLGYYFVGPDNGLFSYMYNRDSRVYQISIPAGASTTFHARDIFGPAAARLATGMEPHELGEQMQDYVRFEKPVLSRIGGFVKGEIVYIDHFGNCITNVPNKAKIKVMQVSGRSIGVKKSYGDGRTDELVCVKGSIGYYEIASNQGSARDRLNAQVGMPIRAS